MFRGILFDLDGTLTPVRSSWQYVHERLGLWTGRAERHQRLFAAGEISYEEFCRLDAGEWKGMPVARLEEITGEIGYLPGVGRLMETVRRAGLTAGIVSTGLAVLADRVARELRLDYVRANHLEQEGGTLTGRVEVRVTHGRKDEAVAGFCRGFGLSRAEVIAVGDSEGDISMFRAAGHAIAFNVPEDQAGLLRAHAAALCRGPGLEDLADLLPAAPLRAPSDPRPGSREGRASRAGRR